MNDGLGLTPYVPPRPMSAIKSIQRVVIPMNMTLGTELTFTGSIAAVDPNKVELGLLGRTVAAGYAVTEYEVTAAITNATTITLTRQGTSASGGTPATYVVQVVEYV